MLSKSVAPGSVEIDKWLDGERKIYSVNVYPLYTLGKAQGNISLIFDITEKQRHLEQMAQLNQLKDQLVTIISHDIRSPLALQFQLVELLEADRQSFAADHGGNRHRKQPFTCAEVRQHVDRLGEQCQRSNECTRGCRRSSGDCCW